MQHNAVIIRAGLIRYIALTHIMLDIFNRTVERRAESSATSGPKDECIACLDLGAEKLGIRHVVQHFAIAPHQHFVAGAFKPAFEAPGQTHGTFDLRIHIPIGERLHDRLHAKAATIEARTA